LDDHLAEPRLQSIKRFFAGKDPGQGS
jgi:hypothetical protein